MFASNPELSTRSKLLIGLLLAIAFLLRAAAAQDAFWLDEIWSYQLVKLAESPLQILTVLQIDNNHPLNSWFIYIFGEQADWFVYRIPAILTGTATVALMSMGARKLGINIWLVLMLGTLSLPLVQYSAEARGYAPAALCGVAAWYLWFFRLQPEGTRFAPPAWTLLFWLTCLIGMLAHLSFIFVLLALAITAIVRQLRAENPGNSYIGAQLVLFSVPAFFVAILWFGFYGQMGSGGDDAVTRFDRSLLLLGSSLLGTSREAPVSIAASLLVILLAVFGVTRLPVAQRWFFSAAMLIVPLTLIALSGTSFFFPRYLLVSMPFFYLAAAAALQAAMAGKQPLAWAAGVILLLILAGSGWQVAQLIRWGKGDYPQAVRYLYENAGQENFTVGGDFDFRHKALIDFYSRFRDDQQRLTYIENSHTHTVPVDFFLKQDRRELNYLWVKPETGAREFLRLENDAVYRFVAVYPYAGLSGWNWYIYQLTEQPSE